MTRKRCAVADHKDMPTAVQSESTAPDTLGVLNGMASIRNHQTQDLVASVPGTDILPARIPTSDLPNRATTVNHLVHGLGRELR